MRLGKSDEVLMSEARKRLPYLVIVIIIFFFLIILRGWHLQIIRGDELSRLSENNRLRIIPVKAIRGKILDRRGRDIANNRASFDLGVVPEDLKDMKAFLDFLSNRLSAPTDKVQKKIETARSPFDRVRILRDLSLDNLAILEENKNSLPGVYVVADPMRNYVYNDTLAHLVGYMGEISKRQVADPAYADYYLGQDIGKYGVEKQYEPFLRGKDGTNLVEVDVMGRPIKNIGSKSMEPGDNVVLTIDIELQQEAERLFGDNNGVLVAIDLTDGGILSMVSKPAFDPNVFAGGISWADWSKLINDEMKPLQNRAIQGTYPPGSTYKIVPAAAALEEGLITEKTANDCPGYFRLGRRRYRCWKDSGHGTLDIKGAIIQSCDVFFYKTGYQLGIDKMHEYALKMGLGKPTGIDLDGEKGGLIPSTEWKEKNRGRAWLVGETISASIGQGYNLVTPLQLAVMIAGVANDGVLLKPKVVDRIEKEDGTLVKKIEAAKIGDMRFSPNTLSIIKEGLRGVVASPEGTAGRARIQGINVSGKTGTAQVIALKAKREKMEDVPYRFRDHAWFIGYAPSESPKIAIAVLVENVGHGGEFAAPIFRDVVKKYFELYPEKLNSMVTDEKNNIR
ncbi:MAG: penicillin-binding protein 2 [Nitrospinota bacterium]|nr:penicillin-binding protein 2 [Nitrospinota bacterium]